MISATGNKQVRAVKDGIYRGNFYDKNGFGNYVSVQHDDGIRTIYAHLESINKDLKKGQHVSAGDLLGTEGTTGFSTGMTAKPSPSGTVRHHGWRPKKAASAWQCRAGRSFFMAR